MLIPNSLEFKQHLPNLAMFTHMTSSTTSLFLVSFLENLQDLNISIRPNMYTIPYSKPLSFSKLTCLNVSDGRQNDALDTIAMMFWLQTLFHVLGFSKQCFRNQT